VDLPVVDVVDESVPLVAVAAVVVVVVVVLVMAVLVVVVGSTAGAVGGGAVSGRTPDGPLVVVGAEAGDVDGGAAVSGSRLPAEAVGADPSSRSAVAGTSPVGAPWVTTWRAAG
jgi:hypothetical protein